MISDADKLARYDDLADLVEQLRDENMLLRAALRRNIRTYRVDDQAWNPEAETERLLKKELSGTRDKAMPVSVNCTSFKFDGICTHQAAPRRLLGPALCIVWMWHSRPHTDPRSLPTQCALCTPRPRPKNPTKNP